MHLITVQSEFFMLLVRPETRSTQLLWGLLQSHLTRLENGPIDCTWYSEQNKRDTENVYYHGSKGIFLVASEARNTINTAVV